MGGDARDDLSQVVEGFVDRKDLVLLVRSVEQEVLLVPAQLQRLAPDGVGQFEKDGLLLDLDEIQVEEERQKGDNEALSRKLSTIFFFSDMRL